MGFFHKLGYGLALIVILGLALNFWGVVLNQSALLLNDNKMPVAESVFIQIADNDKIVHKSVDENTRGYILIDWIPIRFSEINRPQNEILNFVYKVYEVYLNYPVEGGLNLVSIGDLMRWIGATLFLLFLIPLILTIPFTYLEDRNERRFNRC